MRIMVVGQSASAHAIAWKLGQSKKVRKIFVAPGNAGTAEEPRTENLNILSVDIPALVEAAQRHKVDFTIVGPTAPLAAGISDAFESHGLKIYAPTKEASKLEWSKDFAKEFMRRHNISTPAYCSFSDPDAAKKFIKTQNFPIVIKSDGSGERGQGVVIARSLEEAEVAINGLLQKADSASGQSRILVESFVEGDEVSFTVMVDGDKVLPLVDSRDHKRLLPKDEGPNTEGMGAYSPAIEEGLFNKILGDIVYPTVKGINEEGIYYRGFLYFGLMVSPSGEVYVLEFNCRLGDPEALTILTRMTSDFADLMWHATNSDLKSIKPTWTSLCSLAAYLVTKDYPTAPNKGVPINLPCVTDTAKVFHAGTKKIAESLVTNGGRVLAIAGMGETIKSARDKVYQVIETIEFSGMHYRKDLADRWIKDL